LRTRRTALTIIAALAILATFSIGCGGPAPTAVPSPSPSASATPRGPASPRASSSATASTHASGISIDPGLLAVVPAAVDGVAIVADPATAAQIAADPALTSDVEALAVGLAVGPGASGAEDLAIVNVVRLRDGVFGEAFYRGWRDTYDAAACEPAGGVAGHAQSELDGRLVYIGSCAGGAFTHHVALESDGLIVSVTSVGARRFGEQIVSNLTP
jgi:hypothetical protein